VSQVFPFFSSSSSSIYGSLSRSAAVARFCGQSVARYAWAPDRYTTRGKQQTYQKTKKPKEKKNLENVATATDFLRLSLFLLPSSSSKPKPKEPENNIALEMSSYITFVLILSVMCLLVV
jgi:hypothetical protein